MASPSFTAFSGTARVGSGPLEELLPAVRRWLDGAGSPPVLFFEDSSGRQVDFDLRGSAEEILARLGEHPLVVEHAKRRGPGRPRLGVVPREVTLLPRHWEWLERHPSGASAALRRVVEEAMRREIPGGAKQGQEAASRVMTALAGDLPGYEEASRALFAGNGPLLHAATAHWPADVRAYVLALASSQAV